jgi:tetratricopeptide (TPR) repeat protein
MAGIQGDHTEAEGLIEQSLALSQEIGDKESVALSLGGVAGVAFARGDAARARSLHEERLAISRELGDRVGIAVSLYNLGVLAYYTGDHASARTLLEESLPISRELRRAQMTSMSLRVLGRVDREQGDYAAARARLEESLAIVQSMGFQRGLALGPEVFATLMAAQGEPERAARLFGAAERLRETIQLPPLPNERAENDRFIAVLRAGLDEETFAAAWAEGRAMTREQAAASALLESDADTPAQ